MVCPSKRSKYSISILLVFIHLFKVDVVLKGNLSTVSLVFMQRICTLIDFYKHSLLLQIRTWNIGSVFFVRSIKFSNSKTYFVDIAAR